VPYTIGIDARKLGDFGIGTYVRNLVAHLAEIDRENHYVLFVGREAPEGLPDNFRVVTESSPVYSVRELLALSWRLHRLKLDLHHATHYVLPAVVPAGRWSRSTTSSTCSIRSSCPTSWPSCTPSA
jgi:hypothetical protein